jgi:hypothetical protein
MAAEKTEKVECQRCHKAKHDPKYKACWNCVREIAKENELRRYYVGQALAGLCMRHGADAETISDRGIARAALSIAQEAMALTLSREWTP